MNNRLQNSPEIAPSEASIGIATSTGKTSLITNIASGFRGAMSRLRSPRLGMVLMAMVSLAGSGCIDDVEGEKHQDIVTTKGYSPPSATEDDIPCFPGHVRTTDAKKEFLSKRYGIDADFLKEKEKKLSAAGPVELIPDSEADFELGLEETCRALRAYPIDVFERNTNPHITLNFAGDIEYGGRGGMIAGLGGEGGITLVRSPFLGTDRIFYHEFVHVLDHRKNDFGKDDATWRKVTGIRTYKGYRIGKSSKTVKVPDGFADDYGMSCEAEDQATIGEDLMDPSTLRFHTLRAMTDEMLRKKIELMTGCVLDTKTARFSKTMTEDEYKAFSGFDGYRYYLQWSDGKMDHNHWNQMLDSVSPDGEYVYRDVDDARHYEEALASREVGDFYSAGIHYWEAHESVLAKEMWLKAGKRAEMMKRFENAGDAYKKAGERTRSDAMYRQAAEKAVSDKRFADASRLYAEIGENHLSYKYATEASIITAH